MAQIDLSCIIVSHNTKALTLKAIESIYKTLDDSISFEILVVDHDSPDGSFSAMRKQFPKVVCLQTEREMGFGKSNNLAAKRAKGEFLFFMNSDVELLPGAISTLLTELRAHTDVGVVSGQLLYADGTVQPQGGALPTLWTVAAWMFFFDDLPLMNTLMLPYQQRNLRFYQRRRETGWIGGTALLMRRDIFESLGGWDEWIFMYGEDVELCARVHDLGKKVVIQPRARIIHYQHQSVGGAARARLGEIEGLLYYWKKRFSVWQLPVLRGILWFGCWLRAVIFGILRHDDDKKRLFLQMCQRAAMA